MGQGFGTVEWGLISAGRLTFGFMAARCCDCHRWAAEQIKLHGGVHDCGSLCFKYSAKKETDPPERALQVAGQVRSAWIDPFRGFPRHECDAPAAVALIATVNPWPFRFQPILVAACGAGPYPLSGISNGLAGVVGEWCVSVGTLRFPAPPSPIELLVFALLCAPRVFAHRLIGTGGPAALMALRDDHGPIFCCRRHDSPHLLS